MDVKFSVILLVAFCAFLGAFGQLFFKLASEDLNFNITSFLFNWKLILGLSLYGISTVLFLFALKQGNLSMLYPIIATSYVWVALFSFVFLGESFPFYRWIGVFLIILGVGVIVR